MSASGNRGCIWSKAAPRDHRGADLRRLTFNATLEEDEFHMLWLVKHYGGTATPHLRLLLSATFKTGWRIVDATPAERAMLEAHGFGSGRVQ